MNDTIAQSSILMHSHRVLNAAPIYRSAFLNLFPLLSVSNIYLGVPMVLVGDSVAL